MEDRVRTMNGWVVDQEYQILEALMSQEEHNARSFLTVTAQGDGYDARLDLEGPLESMLPFDNGILERFSEDYKENPNTFNSQKTTPNAQPVERRRSASPTPSVPTQPEPLQTTAARSGTNVMDSASGQNFITDQVHTNSKQVMLDIDWNDVELELDATLIGEEVVLMPMIDLMLEEKEFSNWYDFDIETLKQRFQRETGIAIDTTANIFAVVNENGEKLMNFRRNGGYQIALKRFEAEYPDKTNVLRLQVEPRPLPHALSTSTYQPMIIGTTYHEQQATVTTNDRKRKSQDIKDAVIPARKTKARKMEVQEQIPAVDYDGNLPALLGRDLNDILDRVHKKKPRSQAPRNERPANDCSGSAGEGLNSEEKPLPTLKLIRERLAERSRLRKKFMYTINEEW